MAEQQNQRKKGKRPRKPKTSAAVNGGGGKLRSNRDHLTPVQKALMGYKNPTKRHALTYTPRTSQKQGLDGLADAVAGRRKS